MRENCGYCGKKHNENSKIQKRHDWWLELRDMSKCPDCRTTQNNPKSVGDDCENEDCESYVFEHKTGGKMWFNPNWG